MTAVDFDGLEWEERSYALDTFDGWLDRVAAPRRRRPPLLSKREMKALSKIDLRRYDEARRVWHANLGPIRTPAVGALYKALDEIIEANRQDGDKVRPSPALDALPGTGKTTAILGYGIQFHKEQIALHGERSTTGDRRIPVVYVPIPARATPRSLNVMLLEFFGHPIGRQNSTELASSVSKCIRSCGTRLVIFDDVHFLGFARAQERGLADHFKWLASRFQATLCFVGVGLDERGFFDEGLTPDKSSLAQTGRRWTRVTVDPFADRTAADRDTWTRTLKSIENSLVLAEHPGGALAGSMSDYLMTRTSGHFQSLMTLIARGCNLAVNSGRERLSIDLLDEVRNDEASERARRRLADERRRKGKD